MALTMAPSRAVLPLQAAGYSAHRLHRPDCAWVEKNCYIDVWIEVLHALQLEPQAMLAFTLGLDYGADQWTFFKPAHRELAELYGIEVYELNLWRGDLLTHALAQLEAGRLVFSEADAWWLPDTQGTDYRRQHTKTTLVINHIDLERQSLGYFHNAGYHTLQGEDFVGLFRLGAAPDPGFMPLYAEYARLERLVRRPAALLLAQSLACLRAQLARAPAANPIAAYAQVFDRHVAALPGAGLAQYHAYAFATLRQLGAAFELASQYMEWLTDQGETGLEPARSAFGEIAAGAKALVLKTARVVNTGKASDFGPVLNAMAAAWDAGFDSLRQRYG